MSDRGVFEAVSSATVLKPGDLVLLTTDERWSPSEMDAFQRGIAAARAEHPEFHVEFLVVSGVESVSVEPGEWRERIEEMWAAHRSREEWAAEALERTDA